MIICVYDCICILSCTVLYIYILVNFAYVRNMFIYYNMICTYIYLYMYVYIYTLKPWHIISSSSLQLISIVYR